MFKQVFKDIHSHKDLILHLTMTDFKNNTARTYLGFLWWILDPILYMGIFYLLVQVILQRGGPDYSVYLFTGLIPLKWATACIVDSTNSIASNARIIQQVYVPKVVFISVRLLVNTFKFLISAVVLFLFLWLYGIDLNLNALQFIPIMIVNALFLFSIMTFLAHIGVFIRDVKNAMQYIARILLYLSPVLFSLDQVPEKYVPILLLNPLSTLLTSYRDVLLYGRSPDWSHLIVLLLISFVLLFLGLRVIMKNEKEYAKVI
ncbi:ABC transporter permease [Bacillus sp. J37]|uniref:ABC transporter permease n=1 Tax=Bacillus sp. J37 TaxID=935837 RepID=UPI00047DDDB9|nr:ABC transporter permease [Bacillus sp. J37]